MAVPFRLLSIGCRVTNKPSLRAQALSARQGLPQALRSQAAQQLGQRLGLFIPPGASIIAGYRAINGEIDPQHGLSALEQAGHRICLPVIRRSGEALAFRQWSVGAPLQKGQYDIEVPADDAPECIPSILLVPLVAFDRSGHRLGYGAGYYDRTIAALRQASNALQIIGVGYSMQQLEHIPAQAHDEKLDAIITEKESIIVS